MIRVTAVCILQGYSEPDNVIKLRLRWEGGSFKVYLCDTDVMATIHARATLGDDILVNACNVPDADRPAPTNIPPQVEIAKFGSYV